MYGTGTSAAAGAGTASLAMTGANSFWMVVTGVALIAGGMLIKRLVPKQEF